REAIREMDVRENSFFSMLPHLFAFDGVRKTVDIEQMCYCFGRVGEHVQVDIGTLPHVAGENTANQPRTKWREAAHHRESRQAHGEQIMRAVLAFEHSREQLDLVANFDVARQVGGLHPALAELLRSLAFRREILRLLSGVHETGGFPSDVPPELR